MDERRGRGQKLRSEGLDRFISLMSKSKVGKARCKDRSSGGGGQRGGGGGQGADGRQGWQGRRAGSSNSIHGCVQVGCRAGRCFVVPLGLGLGLAWTVSLGVTGATGVCTLLSWLEKLLEYLGTEGMTILGPGSWFWALGLRSAGSRSRATSLVRARLVACNAVCMQWMQYDTAIQYRTGQLYGTVRYCLTIRLLWNSNDKDKAQAQAHRTQRATLRLGREVEGPDEVALAGGRHLLNNAQFGEIPLASPVVW